MPIAKFQLPDGRIGRFEVPEGTTPERAQAMIGEYLNPAPRVSAREQILTDQITQDALNPAGSMSVGQQFAAGAGKALTDIGRGIAQVTGLGPSRAQIDESRDRDVSLMATPGGFLGNLAGNTLATAPAVLAGPGMGAAIGTGATMGLVQPVGEGESRTLNTAIGGATGGAMKMGMDRLAPAIQALAQKQAQQATTTNTQNAVRAQTLAQAQDAGYVVPPSAAGGGFFSKRLESVGGKAAIGQEAAMRNQEVTNALARKALGLPEGTAITEATLKNLRDKVAQPYREVSALSKVAETQLEQLKRARFDESAYFRHYQVSADPASLAKARAADATVQRLEKALEGHARNAGKPDLIAALRDARKVIAKSYDVEKALNVGTADISAPILGKALDKGRPQTGELATVAKFAEGFPAYAREAARIPTPGVSKSEALTSALLGVGGFGVGGPAGALAGALPLLSGPARALALSPAYQRLISQQKAAPPALTQLIAALSNNPQVRRALPAAGAALSTYAVQE